MKKANITILALLLASFLYSGVKAVWIPIWDLTNEKKIDTMLKDLDKLKVTQILAEVRYRADALYIPNRINNDYPNPDPRNYLLKNNDFDPLGYLIAKAKPFNIEVHAWVTTFVATTHDLKRLPKQHLYFANPDWVTDDFTKKPMMYNSYEGAFFDPGNPEVQKYTLNVILDIVANYDLDGIHLDYIRYPDTQFGFNKFSRKEYDRTVKYQDAEKWRKWKEDQVSNFVRAVSENVRRISPQTSISAAVFPKLDVASEKYSQDWLFWLNNGWVDNIYIMAYTKEDDEFLELLSQYTNKNNRKKIVTGLRAWDYGNSYPVTKINSKILISKKGNFAGVALFSYSGLVNNGYLKTIKLK